MNLIRIIKNKNLLLHLIKTGKKNIKSFTNYSHYYNYYELQYLSTISIEQSQMEVDYMFQNYLNQVNFY